MSSIFGTVTAAIAVVVFVFVVVVVVAVVAVFETHTTNKQDKNTQAPQPKKNLSQPPMASPDFLFPRPHPLVALELRQDIWGRRSPQRMDPYDRYK